MKAPKFLAVGLIAAGLVIGGSATAHAAVASQYVTVLWSYPAYPDLTQPQPFVSSYAGADLHAFDATLAQADSCGHPFQVDVYKVEVDGRSWETLKETGSLLYAHDGGFLAYDAGVGTPYRVITPEEYPCTNPNPGPSPTTTSSPEPSTQPSGTPSASPSTTPSAAPTGTPSASLTPTPSPTVPLPPSTPSSTPSAVASSTPNSSSSPTATGTPSASASVPSSTPSGTQARELAYTGANPWPGIGFASVLVAVGLGLLLMKRVRRG